MDFKEQVLAAVDIVRVVSEFVPTLKRVGSTGRYSGLCPFHNEKTPSFSVHASRQFYICFGCGAKGDVFKFVMEMEGVSFYEALKLLAERNGVPIPKRPEHLEPEAKLRLALERMHEIAAELFQQNLAAPAGTEARAYLARRGVSAQTMRDFGLGLAERGGGSLLHRLEREGFPADQLEVSGLVLKRESGGFFDRFRGRLMFPIHNESGKAIGFGGRALAAGDEPKYLNSPETAIYKKSFVLYNLHRAKEAIRKAGRTVLVEGYMDAIGLWAAGVKEAVASCGTALTSSQVRALRRHSASIVVNFDPDAAGSNAAERSLETLLDESMHVRILELDEDLDPDEYVARHGPEVYREKLDKAAGYFHWLAGRVRKRHDLREAEGRMAAFQELLPAIQRISDKLERVSVADDVASYLGVERGLVLEQFRKAAAERKDRPRAVPPEPLRPLERMLLGSLLASPEARREYLPRIAGTGALEEFRTARIFRAMLALQEAQADFSFAELEARLEDRDRTLLMELAFADEVIEQSAALEQAAACSRKLEEVEIERRRSDLRSRIKSAEREGRFAEALTLMAELGPNSGRPA